MKIPFSPPDIGEAEIAQVADTLRSGWITTGPKTKELERQPRGVLKLGHRGHGADAAPARDRPGR